MIGIDGTVFDTFDASGMELTNSMGIYVKDVVSGFQELGFADRFVLLSRYGLYEKMRYNFPEIKVIENVSLLERGIRRVTNNKKSGVGFLNRSRFYRENSIDYIWYPTTLYRNNKNVRFLSTILDFYFYDDKDRDKFSLLLSSADKLVAISTYTAEETRSRFPEETEGKTITIIPTPIKDTFDLAEKPRMIDFERIKRPYILDLNTMRDGKNPLTLLKAYGHICNQIDVDLVFCSYHFSENELKPLRKYAYDNKLTDRVHFIQGLSMKERNWVLKNAKLFVTPAIKEGFGRTPVEAGMCNVPVISAKESALYETTMGIVNYYDNAFDDIELARVIKMLFNNYPTNKTLVDIGNNFRTEYSPKVVAEKYLTLFKEYVEG